MLPFESAETIAVNVKSDTPGLTFPVTPCDITTSTLDVTFWTTFTAASTISMAFDRSALNQLSPDSSVFETGLFPQYTNILQETASLESVLA